MKALTFTNKENNAIFTASLLMVVFSGLLAVTSLI